MKNLMLAFVIVACTVGTTSKEQHVESCMCPCVCQSDAAVPDAPPDVAIDASADAPPDVAIDAPVDAVPDAPPDAHIWNPNPARQYNDPTGAHNPVVIEVPNSYASSPQTARPLLITLGGYGSDLGTSARNRMGWRYIKDLQPNGVLVLSPDGLRELVNGTYSGAHYWNADPACCDKQHRNNDDVAYLRGMIEWYIAQGWNIDRRYVIVTGDSNGAFMAERAACDLSDLVTITIDVAGAGQSTGVTCHQPQYPVASLVDHSNADTGIKYIGGLFPGMSVNYPPALTTIAQRGAQAGCSGALALIAPLTYDHDNSISGNDTDRYGYPGCTWIEHWYESNSIHVFPRTTNGQPATAPITTVMGDHAWAWAMAHPGVR